MFFSYALLLFLLGISVNALPMSFETAAQKVKITVSGMDVSNTRWYRLELPTKDPMVCKIFPILNQLSVYLTNNTAARCRAS